jgi:hypothetical protein
MFKGTELEDLFASKRERNIKNFNDAMKGLKDKEPVKPKGIPVSVKSIDTAEEVARVTGLSFDDVMRQSLGWAIRMVKHVADGGTIEFHHPNWKKPKILKIPIKETDDGNND